MLTSEDIEQLRRMVDKWNREVERWSEKRRALPHGSSRAKITTANAQYMLAAETRDKFAQRLYDLTGEVRIAADGERVTEEQ